MWTMRLATAQHTAHNTTHSLHTLPAYLIVHASCRPRACFPLASPARSGPVRLSPVQPGSGPVLSDQVQSTPTLAANSLLRFSLSPCTPFPFPRHSFRAMRSISNIHLHLHLSYFFDQSLICNPERSILDISVVWNYYSPS